MKGRVFGDANAGLLLAKQLTYENANMATTLHGKTVEVLFQLTGKGKD